jgi:hypothetical protein
MRSQQIRLSFKKAYEGYDAYGDRIMNYVNQEPIFIWLTYKDIIKFYQTDLQGLQYDYVGMTKDQRPETDDLIDDKKVVYKIIVNRWCYLFLQDMRGEDDV